MPETPNPAAAAEALTAYQQIADSAHEHGWLGQPARPISIYHRSGQSVDIRFNRNGTVRHASLRDRAPGQGNLLESVGQGTRDRRASVLRWITAARGVRDLLAEILSTEGVFCGVCDREAECPDCQDDLARIADAILSDPRIAVVQLPEVEPESFEEGPTHAKLPHAEDKWPRVQRRRVGDNRIALASIHNPFRTDTEAADTAAAILAILRHTNNRGDQS